MPQGLRQWVNLQRCSADSGRYNGKLGAKWKLRWIGKFMGFHSNHMLQQLLYMRLQGENIQSQI
jgi:hypothetical protein